MVTITLKGREIPLLYTTYEMKLIQERIAPLGQAIAIVTGRNPEDAEAEQLDGLAKLIVILGNAGLEDAGEEPDLTEKKVLRAMKPAEFTGILNACMDAMAEGMKSEIPEKEETGPVDVTLEEMKKKGGPEG